jgi:hypothetical protein
MLQEDIFEIPLPPKVLKTSESTSEDTLYHGKRFLKSPFPANSKFSKILL